MEKPTHLQAPNQAHVLFELSPLDGRDDIDDKTQRSYLNLKQMTANKPAKECHELYSKFVASNVQQNTEELTMGLLVGVLIEPEGNQNKYYRDAVAFSKDGMGLFCNCLNMIIVDRLNKLREHSIRQIFWITNQLMKATIDGAENVCYNLIRQIAGGDLSAKNLWLTENMLDLLIDNRHWLINSTGFMVPTVVYNFMRLILDHMDVGQSALRKKEVDFVIGLVREKFWDILQIGRDFLRLLRSAIKISEFEKLWHDIHNNPKSLHPNFSSPIQLLSTRTPRRLIVSRLTFDMERKMCFLATQVKFGNQKRYQDWFHKQYLATPESLSLRCDLIRYICTTIHPSNEVLCSEIIPRWAIIGWLLTTCTTNAAASASKLALFFDWLVYDVKTENIMNIEPAILVMYCSNRSHPNVTASLLDYLCRIPMSFSPPLNAQVKSGIKRSLQQILEKRVIASVTLLFDNPKHDRALKALIRETFPEFCSSQTSLDNGISHPASSNLAPPTSNATNSPTLPSPSAMITNNLSTETSTTTQAPSANNSPASQPINSTSTSGNNHPGKVLDVITIDGEKQIMNSVPSDGTALTQVHSETPNSTPTEPVKIAQQQDSKTNHNHSSNLKPTEPTVITIDDRSDQATPTLSSTRDDSMPFTWNGTDNTNVTYSHKQLSNHDTKNKKPSIANSIQTGATKELIHEGDCQNNLQKIISLDHASDSISTPITNDYNKSRILYSFMTVPQLDLKEAISSFNEPICSILEDLSTERCNEARCSLMDKLISAIFFDSNEPSNNQGIIKELGHCLAHLVSDDFSTRISPTPISGQDRLPLDASISSPFFVLCRSAFSSYKSNWVVRPMALLVSVSKFFEATGFLVLYFLRVKYLLDESCGSVSDAYSEFCASAKRKMTKCLYDDLFMALTYDSEMFCFLLPSVFSDLATCGNFAVTGNIELIHLVVSAIDPINLQELICLCLTGTCKVINKEDVLPLIETSLNWESWEQYCLWKLISAQSVPIENYISILPKLQTKANAEAMSCILLNLQKVTEPTPNMLQQIISSECKAHDPYFSSILRYWSMRTDTKQLAVMISSLGEANSSSPPVKRKGHTKSNAVASKTLNPLNEKILLHLDSIRQRAPKNKLLAQTEITDLLTQLEVHCNESQRKRFADLFTNRSRPSKKQKKMDTTVLDK